MGTIQNKESAMLVNPKNVIGFNQTTKNEIPIIIFKYIVRAYQSYLITGDQGCGKTTTLKSFIRYYPMDAALRVNEIQPELNLRYAYPGRNIISFSETPSISTQDGLNFQKKTSGTVNIIGEIASAEASTWWVQTCKVGSKSGAGTHHGKSPYDTISAIKDNIKEVVGSTDDRGIEIMVADALDFDIHMSREGFRHMERITEILPVKEQPYPYPDIRPEIIDGIPRELAIEINRLELAKRLTDRTTFTSKNIVEYDEEAGRYVLKNMFSDVYYKSILSNLPKHEQDKFEADMEYVSKL